MTSPRRLLVTCIAVFSGFVSGVLPAVARAETPPQHLLAGISIERELAGGQSHSYQIMAETGQYLRVTVEQLGLDVVVELYAPDAQKLAEVDGPYSSRGTELAVVIAPLTGSYRLVVVSHEQPSTAGKYKIQVTDLRAVTPAERDWLNAQEAISEAAKLRKPPSAENLRRAVTKYEEALTGWRALGDEIREAETLNEIGGIYQNYFGEPAQALRYRTQALELFRQRQHVLGEAQVLGNIGYSHFLLGDPQQAESFTTQALTAHRATDNPLDVAIMLDNLGLIYAATGEMQAALAYHQQALQSFKALGRRSDEGIALTNLAQAFSTLGNYLQALEMYKQSFALATNPAEQGLALRGMGVQYFLQGEVVKAVEFYEQALPLYRQVNNRRHEAWLLSDLGYCFTQLADYPRAQEHLTQALVLSRTLQMRNFEAWGLYRLSVLHVQSKQPEKALDTIAQTLSLSRLTGDNRLEAEALRLRASLELERGDLDAALRSNEESLRTVEAIRSKVVSQQLRVTFQASNLNYYTQQVEILMRQHQLNPKAEWANMALQVAESSLVRGLLDLLTEAHTDIRQGVDPDLLAQERRLQQQINAKALVKERLSISKQNESKALAIGKELIALTTENDQLQGRIRATSPSYAALTQPQPLTAKEIQQQLLDEDTLLLEFALGEKQSYLWVVSPQEIKSYPLPSRAEITAAARKVYDQWTQIPTAGATTRSQADAQALSQMLLGVAASQLGNKRLLIVAPEILAYVPFSALPEPELSSGSSSEAAKRETQNSKPLILNHEIVNLPSASVLAVLRKETAKRKSAPKTVAVLADPVFEANDPRVAMAKSKRAISAPNEVATNVPAETFSRAVRSMNFKDDRATLGRLAFSRDEADAIAALTTSAQGMKAVSFDASRTTAMSDKLGQFRIVHFATHGFLNSEHPELSGLVFSMLDEQGKPQDGFLRLHEIYNLKLPADLVVLSACQTGLGKEIKGEGLIGLTRGFMYAGAERVVASLWRVNDYATAELMKQFYRGMLKENLRPAAALRAAQLSMWKRKRFNNPYFWAAFTMQGEWR